MTDPAHYQTLAEYNQWMNRKLYAICAEIPDAVRKQDQGAFFGSIHGTLNHLLFGDRVWIGRFINQLFTAKIGDELYSDFAELRQAREQMDQQILAWTQQLSPEWLSQPFTFKSGVDGKTRTMPAWILVTHLFNHQTHHRGQLTTLLSQNGYNPGVTDLPMMPSLNLASPV